MQNGTNGHEEEASAENQNAGNEKPDPKAKYVNITKDGWLETRIHLSHGIYTIYGFFKEVEDIAKNFYEQLRKKEEEKKSLLRPGFRGFNPFGKR